MAKSQNKGINFFDNVNLGGIAESNYQGVTNSVSEIVKLDIHSEGGVLKTQQKLTDIDTSDIIDDLAKAKVECSDGAAYFFGSTNGKVWRYTEAGNLTLQATIGSGVIAAEEHDGYIYYATQNNLGRVAVPSSGFVNWSGKNDSWATFTNKDADFHPMLVLNLVLYIGDGNLVAQVEDGVFSANALDIKKPFRIKSLGMNVVATTLLIGTYVSDNKHTASVISWNTWSPSYSVEDKVPESGINAFLKVDNMILVSAGDYGNIYSYDNGILSFEKRIKGDYSETKCTVHNNAVANFRGLPLFGLSQVSGNGVKYGVYSFGRYSPSFPFVTALEYIGTHDSEIDVEYGAIINTNDGFLVTWKKGSTYGVDKYDKTTKATGYITSRIIMVDRTSKTEYGKFYIPYEDLPADTSVKLYISRDGESFTEIELVKEDKRKQYVSDIDLSEMVFGQIKLEIIPNSNDTPKIQLGILTIKN